MNTDQGLTFAKVFRGVIQGGAVVVHPVSPALGAAPTRAATRSAAAAPPGWFPVLSGQWVSLPLGSTQDNGDLTLGGTFCKNLNDITVPCDPSQPATAWNLLVTQSSNSPLFANPPNNRFQWQKLFDRNTNPTPQIVAPSTFDLGTVTNGIEATGRVPISNAGTAPLIIQTNSSSVPRTRIQPCDLDDCSRSDCAYHCELACRHGRRARQTARRHAHRHVALPGFGKGTHLRRGPGTCEQRP